MSRAVLSALPHSLLFFFNDTATTEIYTLSLHDALPISCRWPFGRRGDPGGTPGGPAGELREPVLHGAGQDRKSTRLNSSHGYISYAVFCLKKKRKDQSRAPTRRLPQPCGRDGSLP